ncbi:MAG: tRNA epoxyqueuosine(34) reductase QueG, partial [Rikenellaceae bacterium]
GDDLAYLHRNLEVRFDASKLLDGGRSVIVCAMNYKSLFSSGEKRCDDGVQIASYALMRDYHKTIRRQLKEIMKGLQQLYPTIKGRMFTDSAPLLEKALAVNAGLGWIGRQSLLITPQFGSFVLLGEILIDDDVDCYSVSMAESGCGKCSRCVDRCPAQAINVDRTIDARRCIACRTIEVEDDREDSFAGWIFGCDICQRVCPHNQKTPYATFESVLPTLQPPTADEWLSMDEEKFRTLTQGTPMSRTSLERIKRSVSINRRDSQTH